MGISFYAYVVHLWSEKNAKTFETRRWPAAGAEEGRGYSQGKHVKVEKTRFARSGVGVGGSGAWRQPSALAGACGRARDPPAQPGPCSAAAPGSVQGETPAESGDPASLPPRGGQLEERAVAGGSRGFHEPEESLCRLLRRAPPRTRSCPGSGHHLAACSGQRCSGRGGPRPALAEPLPAWISPSLPGLIPSLRPEQRKNP